MCVFALETMRRSRSGSATFASRSEPVRARRDPTRPLALSVRVVLDGNIGPSVTARSKAPWLGIPQPFRPRRLDGGDGHSCATWRAGSARPGTAGQTPPFKLGRPDPTGTGGPGRPTTDAPRPRSRLPAFSETCGK